MPVTIQKPERYALGGLSPIGGGSVDRAAGTIGGVCIATAGVPVEGHGYDDEVTGEFVQFWTDAKTLETLMQCATAVGEPLKAKLEHGTGLKEIVGTYSNWRIEGDKLLADFAAAPTCEAETKDHIFWMAETMPSQFGVSVTAVFSRAPQSGGTALMRCVELRSADFVDEPAINASLFSKDAAHPSPLNSKTEETEMNEEQLKKLKAEIREEVAAENKEAIAEAVKEAVKEITEAAKLSAEGEKPEGKTETEQKPEDEKLEKQELSKSIAAMVLKELRSEGAVLGLSAGAKIQPHGAADAGKSKDTFAAALSAKKAEGKLHHVALKELSRERPELVAAEVKSRGVPSLWML